MILVPTADTDYTFIVWSSGCTANASNNVTLNADTTCKAIFAKATNGSCGTANGTDTLTKPTTGLCATGTNTVVDETSDLSKFTWSCSGSSTGTNSSCAAPRQYELSYDTDGGGAISSVNVTAGNNSNLPTPTKLDSPSIVGKIVV